jgi:hypothetical protein
LIEPRIEDVPAMITPISQKSTPLGLMPPVPWTLKGG